MTTRALHCLAARISSPQICPPSIIHSARGVLRRGAVAPAGLMQRTKAAIGGGGGVVEIIHRYTARRTDQAAGVSCTTMRRYFASGTMTSSCFLVRTRNSFSSSYDSNASVSIIFKQGFWRGNASLSLAYPPPLLALPNGARRRARVSRSPRHPSPLPTRPPR